LVRLANLTGSDRSSRRAAYAEQGYAVEAGPRGPAGLQSGDPQQARRAAETVVSYLLDGPYDGALLDGPEQALSAVHEVLLAAGVRAFTTATAAERDPAGRPERIVEIGAPRAEPTWSLATVGSGGAASASPAPLEGSSNAEASSPLGGSSGR